MCQGRSVKASVQGGGTSSKECRCMEWCASLEAHTDEQRMARAKMRVCGSELRQDAHAHASRDRRGHAIECVAWEGCVRPTDQDRMAFVPLPSPSK
eukprot:364734-Chlamydomonas_euryale.AAC.4